MLNRHNFIAGTLVKLRRRREKCFFTLGFLAGGAAVAVAVSLLNKFRCKKCIKRMLSERKQA